MCSGAPAIFIITKGGWGSKAPGPGGGKENKESSEGQHVWASRVI